MFPWMRRYLGAGSDTFSDDAQKKLATYANEYATDFSRAFSLLSEAMQNWGASRTDIMLAEMAARYSTDIGLTLSMVSGRLGKGVAEPEEITKLDGMITFLTTFAKQVASGSISGGRYKQNIEGLESEFHPLNFKELSARHKTILSFLNSESGGNAWKRKLGDLATPGMKTMGKLALVTLLGPAAVPGAFVWGLGKGIYDRARARTKARKESIGERASRGLSGSMGGYGGLFGGARGGGRGGSAGEAGSAGFTGGGGGSRAELMEFFGEPAYQTKWTKEVIELLREMSPHKKSKSEGGGIFSKLTEMIGGVGKWLAGMMPAVLPGIIAAVGSSVAVLLAGAGGYALGTWLTQQFPQIFKPDWLSGPQGALTQAMRATDAIAENRDAAAMESGLAGGVGYGSKMSNVMVKHIARNLPDIQAQAPVAGMAGLASALTKIHDWLDSDAKKAAPQVQKTSPTQPNVYDSSDVWIEKMNLKG